jgi:polysaccharide deacetylase family protein (PEP-CTERM system associated)
VLSINHIESGCLLIKNHLTIDVEDYYQVSAFEKICGPEKWETHASRVVENTGRMLDILDRYGVKATFFILGWTAEKFPGLVARIHQQGHEIACHSYYHRLVYNLSPLEFREDTRRAKDMLEQITGRKILGYRAPSYSINAKTLWAFDILEELGFEFDSSIFPIYHDRYGMPDAPRFPYTIPGLRLTEYPLSTTLLWKRRIPIAGGGYFRLFPYWFVKRSLSLINQQEQKPFIFYLHPWEIDPGQPRMRNADPISRFRHYVNLGKTSGRFEKLLQDFAFAPLHG